MKNIGKRLSNQLLGKQQQNPNDSALLLGVYRRLTFLQPVYRNIRTSVSKYRLRKQIERKVALAEPCRIVIGANRKPRSGWILTEIYNLDILNERDWKRNFTEEGVDALLAEHVWEHLTIDEGIAAARFCFQYLKPGGYLRVAVPDGYFPSTDYIDYVRPGGFGPSADDHKILYTHDTFGNVFKSAGFKVELLEYWDEHGQFHSSDWDADGGTITRSNRFAKHTFRCHNGEEHKYTSIILDAKK